MSLAFLCCAQEELLWFLMVAALTMCIPLIPQRQEADSGEKAHASVNQVSGLVMLRAGEKQQGACVSNHTSLGAVALSLKFIHPTCGELVPVTGMVLV